MKVFLFSILIALAFSFTASADSFEAPEIPGWKQDGEVKTFEQNTLFNHINGAAEFYFSYNFQKVWVVRYVKDEAEVILEVYDQGDQVHAYGIYSMERPPEAEVSDIGAEGYSENNILNFVADQYYVKLNSYHVPDAASSVLMTTAKNVSDMLSDDPELPEIIKAMPEENLVDNTRQYVSNTFMGLEFLGGAYRATYRNEKDKLTMFVIERESSEEIKDLLTKYHEFTQAETGGLVNGKFVIEDPFNGTIHLNWKENYLIGFSGDDIEKLRDDLLEKTKIAIGI